VRAFAVFVVVLSVLVVVGGDFAEAAPVPPCVSSGPERFQLRAPVTVKVDGVTVMRDARDGLFHTDAGVFDAVQGTLSAATVPTSACSQVAPSVLVNVLDPFEPFDAGVRGFTLGREVQP
jgi:hypothetical protein